MAKKIVYKNHCTPQEQADFSYSTDRWYLDSDVGRKLSGVCESKATITEALVTSTSNQNLGDDVKFIYVKNKDTSGSNYVLLNIGSMGAVIKLGPGESFASDVGEDDEDSTTVLITMIGTPTFEFIEGR